MADPTFLAWEEFDKRAYRGWRYSGGFDLEQHWVTAQRQSKRPGGPMVSVAVNHPDATIAAEAALECMDRIDGVV